MQDLWKNLLNTSIGNISFTQNIEKQRKNGKGKRLDFYGVADGTNKSDSWTGTVHGLDWSKLQYSTSWESVRIQKYLSTHLWPWL